MTSDTLPEPLIIPRSEHPISRKNIDREALKVLYRLRDAGFTAYLVGGGVRDLYLNKKPKDFDISTNARPGELRKLFRNSRIIGRRFRLVQVFFHGGKIIEVSTFRRRSEFDINKENEVLPSNNTFGNAAEDAFRRDLTINALFYEIENFSIIDYIGGVEDLKNGIIRIVGDPGRRIVRDPVRMMRAIRHAARSGFTIEQATWQAILEHREKLALCPVSRLRDELLKDLKGGASKAWARLAIESGLLYIILPLYKEIIPPDSLLEPGDQPEPLALLLNIFGVIDRLHAQGQNIPEHILLALLLIPWADAELHLMAAELRGAEAFAFSRQLRSRLDQELAHLNIKRAMKEAITSLLTFLPLFKHNDKQAKWPKWMVRKSYFKEGLQFYKMYKAAIGAEPVTDLTIEDRPLVRSRPRKRTFKRGGRAPAYARSKGGVFGFKR